MNVERAYRGRIQGLSPADRIRRADELFRWSRDYLGRSILASRGPLPEAELRCEIARRVYGADPATRRLLDRMRGGAAD